MPALRSLVPLALACVVAACATSSPSARGGDRNVLTRAEFEDAMPATAFDAVRHARPMWLQVRGRNSFTEESQVNVYIEGVRVGGPEVLHQISAMAVERLEFYGASQAQTRFGLGNTNGVIEVIMRKGP